MRHERISYTIREHRYCIRRKKKKKKTPIKYITYINSTVTRK